MLFSIFQTWHYGPQYHAMYMYLASIIALVNSSILSNVFSTDGSKRCKWFSRTKQEPAAGSPANYGRGAVQSRLISFGHLSSSTNTSTQKRKRKKKKKKKISELIISSASLPFSFRSSSHSSSSCASGRTHLPLAELPSIPAPAAVDSITAASPQKEHILQQTR